MRIRGLSLLLAVIGIPAASFAFDWPGNAPVAVEFGGPNAGSPMPGIVLAGTGIDVRAAEAGELVFERGADDAHTKLPSATGETLVLEGADEMSSVYAYLPGIADPGARSFAAGALIGKAGPGGFLDQDGFMFALFDRKSGRWVNPRVFLPNQGDSKAPVIRKVSLESKGKLWILGDSKIIPQGSYSIILDVAEQGSAFAGLVIGPPWYIRVLANGQKVVEAKTEIAEVKGGALSFYPALGKGQEISVDSKGSIHIASQAFSRGKLLIEVLVRDFEGNERSAAWSLLIE